MTKHYKINTLQNDSEKLPENFAFVMNVSKFRLQTPYQLSSGFIFRQAIPNEINIIDQEIENLAGFPHNLEMKRFWKRRLPFPGQLDELLPDEEWRYFVIEFNGLNSHLINSFQAAADISLKEIEIGFTITYQKLPNGSVGHLLGYIPTRFSQVIHQANRDSEFFIDIEVGDLDLISSIYPQLMQYDPQPFPPAFDIKNLTLLDLNHLKSLPYRSHLQLLGYFAILESLLTHKPKPTDPYESITRQVKKKLTLLNNLWIPKLDYTAFGNVSAEKIWDKMYDLRSRFAHGDRVTSNDLGCLKDYKIAFSLLTQTVKSILRYTLTNTKLLVDLREC